MNCLFKSFNYRYLYYLIMLFIYEFLNIINNIIIDLLRIQKILHIEVIFFQV